MQPDTPVASDSPDPTAEAPAPACVMSFNASDPSGAPRVIVDSQTDVGVTALGPLHVSISHSNGQAFCGLHAGPGRPRKARPRRSTRQSFTPGS